MSVGGGLRTDGGEDGGWVARVKLQDGDNIDGALLVTVQSPSADKRAKGVLYKVTPLPGDRSLGILDVLDVDYHRPIALGVGQVSLTDGFVVGPYELEATVPEGTAERWSVVGANVLDLARTRQSASVSA